MTLPLNDNASAPQDAPLTLKTGAMIGGRFEVIELVRRDFVGAVYHARDGRSQRVVECLLINLNSGDNHQLIELRAHIHEVKKIRLKSFASTYGIGKQGVDGYMVRQIIEGRPLTDHLNHRAQHHRPFKQRGLCSLLIEVIQALEALEDQSVISGGHGLIRPSAIKIQNHQKPRVRLTDIGLGLIRPTLTKNHEYDPWSRGCVPELRGEKTPEDADIYALGALLFQMTQLRPFTSGWLRELSVPPAFSQLPDIIEACTASHTQMSLHELKNELKYAAQSQVESGGLTRDLSQLQERLQKIIEYDQAGEVIASEPEPRSQLISPRQEAQALSPEASISEVFYELPKQHEGAEVADVEPFSVDITPPPQSTTEGDLRDQISQVASPVQAVPPEVSPVQVDMSALNDMFAESSDLEDPQVEAHNPLIDERFVSVSDSRPESDSVSMGENAGGEPSLSPHGRIEAVSGVQTSDVSTPPYLMDIVAPNGREEEFMEPQDALSALPSLSDLPDRPVFPSADDPEEERWIVVRSGIDYGPYSFAELSNQLFDETIGLDTEIYDIETDERAPLGEFSTLDYLLNEWAQERLARRKQKVESDRRRRSRQRALLFMGVVATLGVTLALLKYGDELRASMLPQPAPISFDRWVAPPPQMTLLERFKENPEKLAERRRLTRAKRARLQMQRDARDMAREAREAEGDGAALNFNHKGKGKKLAFSRSALNRTVASRFGKITTCIEAEHGRRPRVAILKVSLTIKPDGRFINAKFIDGTKKGTQCIFKALRGLKMPAFSGGRRSITLPYQVK